MTSHDISRDILCKYDTIVQTLLYLQPSTSTHSSSCLQWAQNSWQCWNWTHPLG